MRTMWGLLAASAALALAGCSTNGAAPTATEVVTVTASGTAASATTPTTTVTETAASGGETEVIDLIAVGKNGQPRAGWTVDESRADDVVMCGDDWMASRSAVSPDIYECSPSAAGAHTCWPSADKPSGLLCGIDPWEQTLVRYTSNMPLQPVAAPKDPQPWGLELADGTKCTLRHGGAWGGRSDGYLGAYSCEKPDVFVLAKDSNAVDTSTKTWTVKVGGLAAGDQALPPPETVSLRRAYFAAAEQ